MRYEDQLMDEADWYNEQSLQVDTLKETIKTQQVEIEALKSHLLFWTTWTNRDKRYLVEQYGQSILEDLEKAIEVLK